MDKRLIIGRLRTPNHLETPRGKLLLTQIQPQEAIAPEARPLAVTPEQEGRLAVVQGIDMGGVLYNAEIVEVVSPALELLVQTLVKDALSDALAKAQQALSEDDERRSSSPKV